MGRSLPRTPLSLVKRKRQADTQAIQIETQRQNAQVSTSRESIPGPTGALTLRSSSLASLDSVPGRGRSSSSSPGFTTATLLPSQPAPRFKSDQQPRAQQQQRPTLPCRLYRSPHPYQRIVPQTLQSTSRSPTTRP